MCLVPSLIVVWRFWHTYPGDLFAYNHQLVVRDYLIMWAGGHLATAGQIDVIFDPHAFATWLWSEFGSRLDLHTWGYPPHLLLLAVPLSQLPIVAGFFIWVGSTTAFLWSVLRTGGLPASYAFAVILSPAAFESALCGQNGALTAAALAGGLLFADRRPMIAGALFGLLTLKPQLGLVVPAYLLARRDWRTIAWATAFGLVYCGAGLAVFGSIAWSTYFALTAPFMWGYLHAPFGLAAHFMMVPPFITMRSAGTSLTLAYGVQAIATMLCIVLGYWAGSHRHADRRLGVALALCLTPLATPYAFSYDLVSVAVACAILVKVAQERDGLRTSERLMLGLAWVWPGSAFLIGTMVCPGLGALSVGTAACVAIRRIWRDAASARTQTPASIAAATA
jgi:hypothetical protein